MNLETEVICGYEVSSRMKKIWAVELSILEKFVGVCQQYGLDYRIMGGTLLGAIRHKGFIPWDNDIDIAMPRRDYNKLLEIGSDVFNNPLFFQTPLTEDSRLFCTYIKIRNCNSTAASVVDFEKGINCGIFIDVFCLDELPDNKLVRRFYVRKLNEIAKMRRFCLGVITNQNFTDKIKHFLQKMVYIYVYHEPNAAELFNIYHKFAGKYAGKNKKEIAHLDFGYKNKFVWYRRDWERFTVLSFEDLKLNAPIGYDAILRKQYGDYKVFPEDKTTHDYYEFDPDIPFNVFFGKDSTTFLK